MEEGHNKYWKHLGQNKKDMNSHSLPHDNQSQLKSYNNLKFDSKIGVQPYIKTNLISMTRRYN
jgi:hypothetical protein